MSDSARRGYLLQAVAIPVWWAAMAASDGAYAYFEFPGISRTALFAFVLPDAVILTACSLAVLVRPNRVMQACVLGGFAYGALWCIAASVMTGGGFLSTTVMTLGTLFNLMLLLGSEAFRTAQSESNAVNLAKTFVQSAVIWTLTLAVFPLGIVHAAGDWPPGITAATALAGGIAFVACSSLGIWSGITMTIAGGGTPLPADAPKRLVVTGPYAYVRNPMAVSGLGQGFSVAVILWSAEVFAYVVVGMIIWNYFVRPEEEAYMERVFGKPFEAYRKSVRCWVPRVRRYAAD